MGFETTVDWWYSPYNSHLNFVPMGFETCLYKPLPTISILFELCPYGIWNQVFLSSGLLLSFIWTLSLWDLKRTNKSFNIIWTHIWTLSLWDLKLLYKVSCFQYVTFELCPYGIWNLVRVRGVDLFNRFELCPYGIWNYHYLRQVTTPWNLNFVPMGFETDNGHGYAL